MANLPGPLEPAASALLAMALPEVEALIVSGLNKGEGGE